MFAGVTILLSMTIFLNTVQVIIPITSDSPLIGKMNIVKTYWQQLTIYFSPMETLLLMQNVLCLTISGLLEIFLLSLAASSKQCNLSFC